nr:translation initiation factor IF-2-like [Symphalangus syndactylus]
MVPLSGRQAAAAAAAAAGRTGALSKFRGLRVAARSPPFLHASDAEAYGWLAASRPSGLAEPGPASRAGEAGAGALGCGCGVGRPALPGAPRPARSLLPPRRGTLRQRAASRRRLAGAQALGSGVRVLDLPRAAGQPGSCGRERWGCMRLARARAKGEGAARSRRSGRPRAPRPARAPGAFARRSRGCGAARVDGARRKFAERTPQRSGSGRGASAETPLPASRTAAPGCPPRRRHADTLAHTGWHRHNPPAGVTGALLPAAKTCPRYGACAKAFPSPGGVSRGGVRCSAGVGGGSWGWESFPPGARRDLAERQRWGEKRPRGKRRWR